MVRALAFTALLLIVVTSASAQGFIASLNYTNEGGAPLTTVCNGSTPIPDGWVVKIYQDIDSDGPDLTDPQATLCTDPPLCEAGPNGTVDFNQFTTNGVGMLGLAGYFQTEYYFQSANTMPATPIYYLRIYDPVSGNFLWTSTVRTLVSGPQDVNYTRSDWTCGTGGPQCVVRDEHE
jgi:hypothetical protein